MTDGCVVESCVIGGSIKTVILFWGIFFFEHPSDNLFSWSGPTALLITEILVFVFSMCAWVCMLEHACGLNIFLQVVLFWCQKVCLLPCDACLHVCVRSCVCASVFYINLSLYNRMSWKHYYTFYYFFFLNGFLLFDYASLSLYIYRERDVCHWDCFLLLACSWTRARTHTQLQTEKKDT